MVEVRSEVGLRIGIESGYGDAFISIEIVSLNSHEIDQTAHRKCWRIASCLASKPNEKKKS